jgi:polar amino acid transport system substrate-binding protein
MKPFKRFEALLWLVLLLAGTVAANEPVPKGTVLRATGAVWAPYVDTSLDNGGLAADLVRTALERAGYTIDAKVETWPRASQGVSLGVYDMVVAMFRSEERAQDLAFSEPYLLNDVVLAARRGSGFEYRGPASLERTTVGIVKDYVYDAAFDTHPGFRRVVNNHLIQNLLLLRQGRIQLVVGDKWAILYELSRFMPGAVNEFEFVTQPVATRGLRLAVSRTNPDHAEIIARFDREITAMREDGSYAKIVKHHTSGFADLSQPQ